MKPGDEKERLEKQAQELAQTAFDLGGIDLVREVEDVFAAEVTKIRNKARNKSYSETAPSSPVHRDRYSEIIGDSPALQRVFYLVEKVAPASVPILIQGESGTGKELVARAVHKNSPRRDKEYVAENCAAIPETLLESELFGYKRGAFTGAERDKQGLFVVADGGTLFLDEIGDMSFAMQKKLLRVLQDGEIRPVGGNEVVHVNVRLISASNKNLREMVKGRLFREDLFYRLNTITIELPPLRDRREDIPPLVDFFVEKMSKEMKMDPVPVSERALKALMRYRWPGNIRELENEIRRCLALRGERDQIDLNDLSEDVKGFSG